MDPIYLLLGKITFVLLAVVVGLLVLAFLSWIVVRVRHTPRLIKRRKEKAKLMIKSMDNSAIMIHDLKQLYQLLKSLDLMTCVRCAHNNSDALASPPCYPVPENYHTCETRIWGDFFQILQEYLDTERKTRPTTEELWDAFAAVKKIIP